MQSQTHKRYLVYLLLVATFALSAASASSQERKSVSANDELPQVGPALPCPFPQHIHLTAPLPNATPDPADFPSTQVQLANWNGTQPDRYFRHTFTWRSEDCCQAIRGTLTFKYKALQGGQSASSPNAGNDGVNIYKNFANLLGLPVYTSPSFPFPAGFTGTKTIPLTSAMLANNRLSFQVQDDTAVLSATLDVDICCVRK